jgi:glycosyltransferase involved in cell wall biosynthesis
MNASPYFSVVLSTYARGEHIVPTIESVLRQSYADFELIVVGDGCKDETAEIVARYKSRGVCWHNLDTNSGSQSAPNNFGIAQATGDWIAYVGHDDIWAPDHLEKLRDLILTTGDVDFAVSGCIYYGPKDTELYYVTGMFDWESAPLNHFFPPTSLAHRKAVIDRIGGWRDPRAIAAPVDCDFLLRAAHAGLHFMSTMRVTVHKFAAGHRYLCALKPSSDEQWTALDDTKIRDESLASKIQKSRQQGHFMIMCYPDF